MTGTGRKLNILMVADYFFPDELGGSKRYIYDISKALAEKSHNIHVLVRRARKNLPSEEMIDGVNVHRYNVINLKVSLFHHYSCILGAFFTFNRLIKKVHFDVINFHHPLSALGVNLSIRSRKIPKIYTSHSCWSGELKLELDYYRQDKFFFRKSLRIFFFWLRRLEARLIQKINFNKCKKIWVLSENSKSETIRYHVSKEKIEVIPGGVDTSRFHPSDDRISVRKELNMPQDKFIIMSAGRLVFRKGFDNLIKAMPEIVKKFREKVYLLIAGDGLLEKELKDLTKRLKLENHIGFLGAVDNEKIPLYYCSSDLFVIPSRYMEPFGLVILEALSSGTPALGTPIGGIKEILAKFDKRLLFDSVEPESISKLIEHFIVSGHEYNEIKNKCRDYILKNYSWGVLILKIENLYYSVRE